MKDYLSVLETKDMFLYSADCIIRIEPLLTKIDMLIGDGDHGLGMKRGFRTVIQELSDQEFLSINDLYKAVGTNLLKSMGGASGILYATLFIGGLPEEQKTDRLTSDFFARTFSKAFEAMKLRGRSFEGQKTLLDTVGPATREMRKSADEGNAISITLTKTTNAAYEGCMNTSNMIAGCGRSRKLGEAALGIPDPGAVSAYYLFASFDTFINGNSINEICLQK